MRKLSQDLPHGLNCLNIGWRPGNGGISFCSWVFLSNFFKATCLPEISPTLRLQRFGAGSPARLHVTSSPSNVLGSLGKILHLSLRFGNFVQNCWLRNQSLIPLMVSNHHRRKLRKERMRFNTIHRRPLLYFLKRGIVFNLISLLKKESYHKVVAIYPNFIHLTILHIINY